MNSYPFPKWRQFMVVSLPVRCLSLQGTVGGGGWEIIKNKEALGTLTGGLALGSTVRTVPSCLLLTKGLKKNASGLCLGIDYIWFYFLLAVTACIPGHYYFYLAVLWKIHRWHPAASCCLHILLGLHPALAVQWPWWAASISNHVTSPVFLWLLQCRHQNSQFSFKEGHPLQFVIDALTKLLLKFLPSITNTGHLNRVPQDHGHKARLRVDQGALDDWCGLEMGTRDAARASLVPFSSIGFSVDYWNVQWQWETQSPKPGGIFAGGFYYFCCRRHTYQFQRNSCFLFHLS